MTNCSIIILVSIGHYDDDLYCTIIELDLRNCRYDKQTLIKKHSAVCTDCVSFT